jgi:hypothetical protein
MADTSHIEHDLGQTTSSKHDSKHDSLYNNLVDLYQLYCVVKGKGEGHR